MNTRTFTRLRVGAVLLAFGLGIPPLHAATPQAPPAARFDLLEQPAATTPRATAALLLAITRAGDRLVAVGERGTVLLSDDNGVRWRQASAVPVSVALTSAHFADAQHGWAVGHGGVVLHSADGGETWVRQLDGRQAAQRVLEAAQAAATGDAGSARRLADAQRLVEDGPDKPLLDVHFVDARRGLVVGAYGLALATEDGGRSWHSIMERIGDPRGRHLYAIARQGERLLVVGEQGAMFASEDGGASFAPLASPYNGTFFGVLLAGDGAVVFGLRGNVFHRAAPGAAWTRVNTGRGESVVAGTRLADGALVLVDEAGRLLRSTDGGARFDELPASAGPRFTALAEGADKTLVMASVRGPLRLAPIDSSTEGK